MKLPFALMNAPKSSGPDLSQLGLTQPDFPRPKANPNGGNAEGAQAFRKTLESKLKPKAQAPEKPEASKPEPSQNVEAKEDGDAKKVESPEQREATVNGENIEAPDLKNADQTATQEAPEAAVNPDVQAETETSEVNLPVVNTPEQVALLQAAGQPAPEVLKAAAPETKSAKPLDTLVKAVESLETETQEALPPELKEALNQAEGPEALKQLLNENPDLRVELEKVLTTQEKGKPEAPGTTVISEALGEEGQETVKHAEAQQARDEQAPRDEGRGNGEDAKQAARDGNAGKALEANAEFNNAEVKPMAANTQAVPGTEGRSINAPQRVEVQLSNGIQAAYESSSKSIQMQLNPEELGSLRIQIRQMGEGQIAARLVVERPETLEAINKQVNELKQNLERAGLKVERIDVVMAGAGAQQSGSTNDQQGSGNTANAGNSEQSSPEGFAQFSGENANAQREEQAAFREAMESGAEFANAYGSGEAPEAQREVAQQRLNEVDVMRRTYQRYRDARPEGVGVQPAAFTARAGGSGINIIA